MILDDDVFIKNKDKNPIDKITKIDASSDKIGTICLLKITSAKDFMNYSTHCEGTVSPQYITNIEECSNNADGNTPFNTFLQKHNDLYEFCNDWYDGYEDNIPYIQGRVNKKFIRTLDIYVENIENIICIKRNMNNIYIKTTGNAQINEYKLEANKKYKITFQQLDRSDNNGEEYFFQKSLIKYIPDYSDELCNKLKTIIENN